MRALILAGGTGTRFWPLSRRKSPKQLLRLGGERSLLGETVGRLAPLVEPRSVWICTTQSLTKAVQEDVPEVPTRQILGEPEGRNTAAAIAWAIDRMGGSRREPVLVLPADHRVTDAAAFRETLAAAAEVVVKEDLIMTLGVRPRWPETGYGYLEVGAPIAGEDGPRWVDRFTEKPDRERAQAFFDAGNYLWNAGIFLFLPATLRGLVRKHLPELDEGLSAIGAAPSLTRQLYPKLPSISIDHGAMEKTDRIATLPLDCGWSDLGSWQALFEILEEEGAVNVSQGTSSPSTPATTCSTLTRVRSPSSGSKAWWSCGPATPCWWCRRSGLRTSSSWSSISRRRAAGIFSEVPPRRREACRRSSLVRAVSPRSSIVGRSRSAFHCWPS